MFQSPVAVGDAWGVVSAARSLCTSLVYLFVAPAGRRATDFVSREPCFCASGTEKKRRRRRVAQPVTLSYTGVYDVVESASWHHHICLDMLFWRGKPLWLYLRRGFKSHMRSMHTIRNGPCAVRSGTRATQCRAHKLPQELIKSLRYG